MAVLEKIETRDIVCANGMPGYLALPAGTAKAPVAIAMHERYGHVKHQRNVAERFAREGFIGFAPNMFFKHPDQKAIAQNRYHYDMTDPESVEYMAAALDAMKAQVPRADMGKVAAMGVCQTGRHVYVTAAELPIHVGLIWYGGASAKNYEISHMYPRRMEEAIVKMKAPIHAVYGEACHTQPVPDVRVMRDLLERHKKTFKIIVAKDSPHGFLNETIPERYKKQQSDAGWNSQIAFARWVFSKDYDPSRLVQIWESDISINYDFKKNTDPMPADHPAKHH
jgi:carboxymethylenebutenolidase